MASGRTATGHRHRTWWERNRHRVISVGLAAPLVAYVFSEASG